MASPPLSSEYRLRSPQALHRAQDLSRRRFETARATDALRYVNGSRCACSASRDLASGGLWRQSLRCSAVNAGRRRDLLSYDGSLALRQFCRRVLLRPLVEGAVGLEQGSERPSGDRMRIRANFWDDGSS